MLVVAKTGSYVDAQDETGHPAGRRFPCRVLAEYLIDSKTCVIAFLGLCTEIVNLTCGFTKRDLWYKDLWNE